MLAIRKNNSGPNIRALFSFYVVKIVFFAKKNRKLRIKTTLEKGTVEVKNGAILNSKIKI